MLPQGVLTLPCVEGAAGHGVWWHSCGPRQSPGAHRLYRRLRGSGRDFSVAGEKDDEDDEVKKRREKQRRRDRMRDRAADR